MRTLFVCRLDHKTTESELYAEFEKHGAIRELKLVKTPEGKSRGYAFIEYQHSGDMKKAYKAYPDGSVRIGGAERPSLVDVERGRTVEAWCVFPGCICECWACFWGCGLVRAHRGLSQQVRGHIVDGVLPVLGARGHHTSGPEAKAPPAVWMVHARS